MKFYPLELKFLIGKDYDEFSELYPFFRGTHHSKIYREKK